MARRERAQQYKVVHGTRARKKTKGHRLSLFLILSCKVFVSNIVFLHISGGSELPLGKMSSFPHPAAKKKRRAVKETTNTLYMEKNVG